MKYPFMSPCFQSLCGFSPEVSLLYAAYGKVLIFFIQSATICLLIRAFSPLTFKVGIDRYVLISILVFVFQLVFINSLSLFISFSFCFSHCGLMILFYIMLCFLSFWFLCICYRFLICGFHAVHMC